MLDITPEVLASFEKPDKTNKKKRKRRSEVVRPLRVTETFNLHRSYLAIRVAYPKSDGIGYDTNPEIMFCSNGFTEGA
jgi:hypothetical protein